MIKSIQLYNSIFFVTIKTLFSEITASKRYKNSYTTDDDSFVRRNTTKNITYSFIVIMENRIINSFWYSAIFCQSHEWFIVSELHLKTHWKWDVKNVMLNQIRKGLWHPTWVNLSKITVFSVFSMGVWKSVWSLFKGGLRLRFHSYYFVSFIQNIFVKKNPLTTTLPDSIVCHWKYTNP